MQQANAIKEMFEVIKKRFVWILLLAVGAGIVSGLFSYYWVTPSYQSSSQFLVQTTKEQEQPTYDASQISTNIDLISTYSVIIRSPRILDIVSEEFGRGVSAQNITVSSESGSQVVTVGATDNDPEQVVKLANTVVEVFKEEIPKLMFVNNVNIIAEAKAAQQISPNPVLNIAIAVVLGTMVGAGLVLLFGYFDNTIKSEADIERLVDIPVIGVISHVDHKGTILKEEFTKAQRNRGRGVVPNAKKKTV
ncbi:YveK family protein [Paraliobacillus sediminis]|uniref:YveK family protein n=1 Tax=Paraliobacillus sediminis TaxID=1885916 RepID=UPI000E3B8634|nr:Wzz/FepE/Etk N-terminal domain-containing protein [Paraliobacillus sediminis]